MFALSRIIKGGLIASFLYLSGCSIMPVNGPESWDFPASEQGPLPYRLVAFDSHVVDVLSKNLARLSGVFPDSSPPRDIRFGIGDIVSVTIFEAASGGLFIPAEASVRPGNFITIPNQPVDVKGNISIPYAGTIRAAGRTQVEVQSAIVNALKNRAIEPQVVVALVDQRTSLISVLGDVKAPNRFPASHAGEHILDAITRAGGPARDGYDEWVMLERNGKRALAPFGALIYEPQNNIFVHPNDTIYLYYDPQTFLAFGAAGGAGATGGTPGQQVAFANWRLSLAEAVAKAGGLNDSTADPGSVFLYRGETREVATALGVDVSEFHGPIVPIIYRINFREPDVYFLATKFEMRNKDVIYISNAISVEVSKALGFFQTVVNSANNPITSAINVYALKAAAKGTSTTTTLVGGAIQ